MNPLINFIRVPSKKIALMSEWETKIEAIAELVDQGTMLVIVDVNRPSITDEPALLEMVKTVVVLDHHRTSSEIIDNAVLS